MSFFDILSGLLFADSDDPKAVKMAKRRHALVVVLTSLGVAFIIISMFAGVPRMGKIAWADDVKEQIQEELKPVQAQLGQITTQLAQQDIVLKNIRADQLSQKLRDLRKDECKAEDEHQKARIRRVIDEDQRTYRELMNERYPLPPCSEIE